MKKIILLMILLMPVIALAAEDKIFSNWKYTGETVTANDIVFSFTFLEDPDRMRLRYGDHYKTLNEGECDVLKGTNNTIKACYEEYEYDIKKGEFKAYLILYSREPDIDIDRDFEKNKIIVGEEIRVDVTIHNTGSAPAYDVMYLDTLEDFDIMTCEGCRIDGNTVTWSKSGLDAGDYDEFSYFIKPKYELERKIAAVFRYRTLRTSEEITTELVEISAENILGVKTKLVDVDYYASKLDDILNSGKDYKKKTMYGIRDVKAKALEKILIGDNLKMIIEITNNKHEEGKISVKNLEIRIPRNFGDIKESAIKAYYNQTRDKTVGSIGLKEVSSNVFRWSGMIDEYREYFILEIKAKLTGHPSIYTNIEFEYDKKICKIEDIKETIEVINVSPAVTVAFEKRDPGTRYYTKTEYLEKKYETESNKIEIMKVRVVNPSNKIKLKGITVMLDSEMLPEVLEYRIGDLSQSRSKLVDTKELIMPEVTRDKRYDFWINISWVTEYGERLEESIKKEIKVEAIKDIKIIHKFSKSNVESGEKFYVMTSLQNTRGNALFNVSASDDYGNFIFKGGISSQRTDIRADTKIDAYKYELVAPKVRNNTKTCINTTVNYIIMGSEYIFLKEDCITVKPKKIDLRIDKRIDDSEIYVGEFFDIDYTIRNRDEETAIDIWFDLPLQSNIDIVSNFEPVSTSRLDKDEFWKAEKKHRIRAKVDGRISLVPITLFYGDLYGNKFNITDRKRIVKIEPQKLNFPVLMINKTIGSESLMSNESLDITLIIENIGLGFASNINVWDGGNEWNLTSVGTNDRKIIKYNLSFEMLGEMDLGSAKMMYSDGLWNYLTASDGAIVEVYMPVEEEELNYTIVEEKPVEEVVEKGFIRKIIDFIKEILFWTKEVS